MPAFPWSCKIRGQTQCVCVCVKAEDGRTAGEESALLHALQRGCKKLGQSLPSR